MRKANRWRGEHKKIAYEICVHMLDSECGPTWCSYMLIHEEMTPEYIKYLWTDEVKEFTMSKVHKYQEPHDMVNNLSWHSGQTFYEQVSHVSGRRIKIGDDWNHSWDSYPVDLRRSYNEILLEKHIIKIIDEFVEKFENKEKTAGYMGEDC